MKNQFSAGGIIYRKIKDKTEILMIEDNFGKWTFPKGHIDNKEKPEETALRESMEETGLKNLKLVKKIGSINFWFKEKWKNNDLIHKTVYYYLFKTSLKDKITPQLNEIKDARWIDIDDVKNTNLYKNNNIVIDGAVKAIKSIER